jgi:hypothetical protein
MKRRRRKCKEGKEKRQAGQTTTKIRLLMMEQMGSASKMYKKFWYTAGLYLSSTCNGAKNKV